MLMIATLTASVHLMEMSKVLSTLWCGTQVRNSAIATLNAISNHLCQLQKDNCWNSQIVFVVLQALPHTSKPNAPPKVFTHMDSLVLSSEHAVMYIDYRLVSLPFLASLQTHTQHSAVISQHAKCYLWVALVLILERWSLELTSLQTLSKPIQAR